MGDVGGGGGGRGWRGVEEEGVGGGGVMGRKVIEGGRNGRMGRKLLVRYRVKGGRQSIARVSNFSFFSYSKISQEMLLCFVFEVRFLS